MNTRNLLARYMVVKDYFFNSARHTFHQNGDKLTRESLQQLSGKLLNVVSWQGSAFVYSCNEMIQSHIEVLESENKTIVDLKPMN